MNLDYFFSSLAANSNLISSLVALTIFSWFIKQRMMRLKNRKITAVSPSKVKSENFELKPVREIELKTIPNMDSESITHTQSTDELIVKHVCCPCCGYKTIQYTYDICEVCWWECDGLEFNYPEDYVIGGPNSDYSLAEAKSNFERLGTKYRESDPRYVANPSEASPERLQELKRFRYEGYGETPSR